MEQQLKDSTGVRTHRVLSYNLELAKSLKAKGTKKRKEMT